jgi:TonB family protein
MFRVIFVIALTCIFLNIQAQKPKLVTNYYYKKLKQSEGNTVNGKKTGTWTFWNEKGDIRFTETYGPEPGQVQSTIYIYDAYFNVNGHKQKLNLEKKDYEERLARQKQNPPQIISQGSTINGLKEGVWKTFDKDGNIITEKGYVRDTINGLAVEMDPEEPKHSLSRITYLVGRLNGSYMTESHDRKNRTEGVYYEGVKTGRWSITNGDYLYIENYKNGKLNGIRTVFYKEQPTLVERYADGVPEGDYSKYLYENNHVKRLTGKYHNGKQSGTFRVYLDTVLKSEWNLVNEVRNGPQKIYYDNGKVRSHMVWKNGVLDSVRTTWDEEGRLETRSWYENGELKKDQDFYQSGKIRQEFVYHNKTSATHTTWTEKGKKSKPEEVPVIQPAEQPIDFLAEFQEYEEVNVWDTKKTDDPMLAPEIPAEFPGGTTEMMKFISKNIRYPEIAKHMNVEGKVFLSFVVQTDGTITDIMLIKSPHTSLEQEAIRVVKLFPKFTPAKNNGVAVKQKMNIPISFTLR